MNESGFWTSKVKLDCYIGGMDGGGFILEANTGKKYNVIFREESCPTNERKILSSCQKLIDLADLKKKIRLYWED